MSAKAIGLGTLGGAGGSRTHDLTDYEGPVPVAQRRYQCKQEPESLDRGHAMHYHTTVHAHPMPTVSTVDHHAHPEHEYQVTGGVPITCSSSDHPPNDPSERAQMTPSHRLRHPVDRDRPKVSYRYSEHTETGYWGDLP
jgi:hypothetical protein